jgi:hypothetical protein
MGKPHSGETNVPIARRMATGKMNALATRGQHWKLTKLLQERRQDGGPNQRPKISLAKQELNETRKDQAPTRPLRAHSQNENGGPTNDFHGGLRC